MDCHPLGDLAQGASVSERVFAGRSPLAGLPAGRSAGSDDAGDLSDLGLAEPGELAESARAP